MAAALTARPDAGELTSSLGAQTSRMRFMRPLVVSVVMFAGCRPETDSEQVPAASPRALGGLLPRIGLAVSDSARAWCAEFATDSASTRLKVGQAVTIVFAGPAPVAALRARLGESRQSECPAEFPQPRWIGYEAYKVELLDSVPPDTTIPTVALIVASDAAWLRGPDGRPRADLDDDGVIEEARRCTADEGEHFTIWSVGPGGRSTRRWHEYYDWGGFTDPTCRPGENGRDESTPGAA